MKKIEVIIRPQVFEELRDALDKVGVRGMNYTEIKGFGRQRGHTETYRGTTIHVDCLPKLRVELVVAEEMVAAVIDCIIATARTGNVGDGKIFVTNVEEVVRIRTGERGDAAV